MILLKNVSAILMLSWGIFSHTMDSATEEVGRKIQRTLDEIAQKKQAIKAQNNSKDSSALSPNMQAYTKHYFDVLLPQAAFGNKQKDTKGVPQQNAQNTEEEKFGRGSSGGSGITTTTQPTSNQGPIGRGASSLYDGKAKL